MGILISGFLAGVSISLGGTVFLLCDSKIVGAVLFSVGLFTICAFGFHLFTGKVCYVFDSDRSYALSLPLIWMGNLLGALVSGILLLETRLAPALIEKAAAVCAVKLSQGYLSAFLLAVFCDLLIYIAVEGYRSIPHEAGKYLAIFFGVTVFVLCGFEHCVANMFYFTVGRAWSGQAVLYLLIMTAGNAVGGVLLPLLRRAVKRLSR
ncbi:MAG: formate/nitrite transporter family protein [Oscillospiraceae bacterium]|nr:formate/nitrite transporter family protein [Oscillospiraceae bacterium]